MATGQNIAVLGCQGADATGVQLHLLDRLGYYTNQLDAASQSLTLPARIHTTTSADGTFNFGFGSFYLRQNRDVSAANVIRVLLLLKLMGFERPTKLQRPPWPPAAAGPG